jgi:hypothetical protein
MSTYEIEQYELHVLTHKITADDEAGAVAKFFQGNDGEAISFEFVGIANDYGMSVSENRDLADRLFDLGILRGGDNIIPSIRSVRQVE